MIEKKHTLITGASGGIGAAIAETFATPDVLLSIHYHRNREQAEQVQKKCQRNGAEVILIQADLSQPDGPERLLAQLTGPVDVFVHAAGHSIRGLLTELTDQDLTELMMVHLFTPMKLARQLLQQ
ncbi:SDR family NAD(P)-dependent oxidoreductase [Alkalicoccobacillus plakortidis]|uniref:SDR family NAD(P)-dependent oxidoreductase n=1 Tax=Alkalicoccobacillus plakortidis TaxID=444060 RepID=A0ABT0XH71_9BACI|nr:SDR family NAD(P)-dependent oxidoreductase [Alkalicoccobacillus plakortidis]MCM2674683.1 SDR family NAD(P)-dependent oxidoreductase [Alkalicoccobacillus plakortidis]